MPTVPQTLERLYLRNFGDQKIWNDSSILKSFVEEHNRMVRFKLMTDNNGQLYDSLFRNIKCCYIPDKATPDNNTRGRAQDVHNHFQELRSQIKEAAREE